VHASTPGVGGPCLAVFPEDERAVASRDEPEQHVDEQNPDGVLHAGNTLVALGILVDVHLAENAERNQVEQERKEVASEEEPRLEPRGHAEEGPDAGNSTDDGGIHPLGIAADTCIGGSNEILGVEADDNDAKDELEEAHDQEEGGSGCQAGPDGGAGGRLLAPDGAFAQEVERHYEELDSHL